MSRTLTVGIRRLGRALFIMATLLGAAAQADAATINVSWTAPTTNANGTPLTDLAGYRVYIDTGAPDCPGGSSHAVASTTDSPGSGQTVSSRITSLTASTTYFIRITAVDDSGNESGCSPQVSGVARSDITVTPTTTVSFGTLATGATADRTFTVQNTSTAAVAGTASVGAPYTIVSGGSFSLGPGATQAVVARFRPTTAGTFAGNVNFTVDGDTLSRAISGIATGSSTPAPPAGGGGSLDVSITQPLGGATVRGSDTAVVWVEGTSGSSNTFTLSVDGRVTGTETTSARGPVTLPWTSLPNGPHTVTASVRDAAGNTGSMSITVNVTGSSATGPPPSSPPPTGACTITPTPSALAFSHPAGGPLPAPQSIRVVTSDATVWRTYDAGFYDATTACSTSGTGCASGQTTSVRPMPTTLTMPAGTYSYPLEITAGPNCPKVTVPIVLTVGGQAPPSAPPPPPSSTGSLQVFITDPLGGATVRGDDTAVVWVDGTSGSSNTFTLSVDGRVTGTETTSARGPVTLPWTSLSNGSHTVTASVRDAAGNTGSMSITVNVTGSSATGPPPPPPPPPVNDTLSVVLTQPSGGTTVGGIVWVVMWVDGASGSSNTFTLSVDGATVASETTSEQGPVTIPWTTSVANGSHTLTAMVRDAAGNTGRASVVVTVRN